MRPGSFLFSVGRNDDDTGLETEPGGQGDKDAFCSREGDYDFALIDWLRLVYVARAHPGALPDDVYRKIVNQLLTVTGGDDYKRFSIRCRGVPVDIRLEDTENHILMVAVARLLTNELRAELVGGKARETTVLRAGPDERIVGFFGRAGGEIDRLGAVFGPLDEARGQGADKDAGLDAGPPDTGVADAGAPDGSTPGPDAGGAQPDAALGPTSDAGGDPAGGGAGTDTVTDPATSGEDPKPSAGGCACSAASGQTPDPSGFLGVTALLWRCRRRRPNTRVS